MLICLLSPALVNGQIFKSGKIYRPGQKNYTGLYLGGGLAALNMDGDYGSKQRGGITGMLNGAAEYKFNAPFILRLNAGKGTLSERFTDRFAYFDHRTKIMTGELTGMFLFPSITGCTQKVQIRPYVGIGAGVIQFETYANLLDKGGERYFFWSDGTVRLADEASAAAETALPVVRDRDFETRVDSLDLYPGVAGIFPGEVGFRITFSELMGLYIAGRYTISTTDHIDHGVAYGDALLTDRARQNLFSDGYYTFSATLVFKLRYDAGRQTYSRKQRKPLQCRSRF